MKEKIKPYKVMDRKGDGVPCIFTPTYNVVVAEFADGCRTDAEIIKRQLEAFPDLLEALKEQVADAEKAVSPSSRMFNYGKAKAAIAKAERAQ